VVKRDGQDARYQKTIEALRAARKDACLSQTELAAKLGKRQQFVSKYESGERRLDIIEAVDICRALCIDIIELLERIGGSK
jgi:transcriptional regulator with XRE-family HTH domain